MHTVDDQVNRLIRSRIRSLRKRKRLSIRQAALLCEIPESSLSCMENGFYRISLLNLKKILDGLNLRIEDVWPESQPGETARSVPDVQKLNFFRFHEIYTLSDSECAALLTGDDLKLVYHVNLGKRKERELRESMETGLLRDWKIFSKSGRGGSAHLCLKNAQIEAHLRKLISIYMDLWLAAGLKN